MISQNTVDTTKPDKKPRAKKVDSTIKPTTENSNNIRKQISLTEVEASELKALADTLHLTESELIKIAIKAIASNARMIVDAHEKTAYTPEMIITDGIARYGNQLMNQKNIGSKNSEIATAYEILKSEQTKNYRSIASKLATVVGTNYNTVVKWLEMYHPEELKDKT